MTTIKTTTWVSLKVVTTVVVLALLCTSFFGVASIPSMFDVIWGE